MHGSVPPGTYLIPHNPKSLVNALSVSVSLTCLVRRSDNGCTGVAETAGCNFRAAFARLRAAQGSVVRQGRRHDRAERLPVDRPHARRQPGAVPHTDAHAFGYDAYPEAVAERAFVRVEIWRGRW